MNIYRTHTAINLRDHIRPRWKPEGSRSYNSIPLGTADVHLKKDGIVQVLSVIMSSPASSNGFLFLNPHDCWQQLKWWRHARGLLWRWRVVSMVCLVWEWQPLTASSLSVFARRAWRSFIQTIFIAPYPDSVWSSWPCLSASIASRH